MKELKAKDFRIGNYVYGVISESEKIVAQISELISFNRGEDSIEADCIYNVLEPIPLSEELLIRFGFELDLNPAGSYTEDGQTTTWEARPYYFIHYGGKLRFCVYMNDKTCYSSIPCEFIHQLQNAYFIVTGKELELN